MSKALMEKLIIANSRNTNKNLKLCITRYGNVIGSRGSVIPTFISQIKKNKALTITNSSMTRFLMTLNEAINLVLFAFNNGKNGDLFIQKSPAATIETISKAIAKKYGKSLKIKKIGLRDGEKMHETLLSQEEKIIAKDLGDYFKIALDEKSLNYKKYFNIGRNVSISETYSSNNTKILNISETLSILNKSQVFKNN